MSARIRAQSAMEYLMTYGWAILIIAVVLGALFSLGVFNGKGLLGTSCIAASGFYCQNPIYSHTDGSVSAVIGQSTGTDWAQWGYAYAKQGTTVTGGITAATFTAVHSALSSGSTSGTAVLLGSLGATSVGSTTSGAIWVCYTLVGTIAGGDGGCTNPTAIAGNTVYYAEIATLTASAS